MLPRGPEIPLSVIVQAPHGGALTLVGIHRAQLLEQTTSTRVEVPGDDRLHGD